MRQFAQRPNIDQAAVFSAGISALLLLPLPTVPFMPFACERYGLQPDQFADLGGDFGYPAIAKIEEGSPRTFVFGDEL